MTFHNTGWDPLTELETHRHNISQLIIGHNRNQELIRDLVEQHHQLVQLLKATRHQVDLLRHEVNELRGQNNQ